ncbi:MAG TPA: GNAT family N-acetyltransferase [Ktedonobacterales bacterium]|nr:GNAT family N-acetyltransferase [Ktedonobacterales bacterium]
MITLEPMTDAEYQHFLEPAIAEYAQDHMRAGRWTAEEALEEARKEFIGLLPDGVKTPNHYLFTLVNEAQQNVGMLWFAMRGHGEAFVYDIRVDDAFQRRGYGSEAFLELERRARDLGATKIALHVFGSNRGAIAMYTKLGYEPTNILMAKPLI